MSHARTRICDGCDATLGTVRGGKLVLVNGVPISLCRGGAQVRVICPNCTRPTVIVDSAPAVVEST